MIIEQAAMGFSPSRPRLLPIWGWLAVLAALLSAPAALPAAAEERIKFVSINQRDEEIETADEKLLDHLREKLLPRAVSPDRPKYERAITKLSDRNESAPYVARVTPYVYVAAEMLGADFEIAGTYVGEAGGTTYHSHFVVNKERFGNRRAELSDLLDFIRDRAESGKPTRFVYHSRFSTSSYFLPALFFRSHDIFARDDIVSEEHGDSSSGLVAEVADGEADFAAVWDGTKNNFLKDFPPESERGAKVVFIQLPTALPNDLLVCSQSLREQLGQEEKTAAQLLLGTAEAGKEAAQLDIGIGDVQTWIDINQAREAREALAELRWQASERRVPVTVGIEREDDRVPEAYLEAARQAVRLSGTEFVLYDDALYEKEDFKWTLGWVREGHLKLVSEVPDFHSEQEFRISFLPADPGAEEQDLAQRIGNILTSRLHRLRYVWPYLNERPLVIRDVPFSPAPKTAVRVQRIQWNDPLRNDFSEGGDPHPVEVKSTDFFKFELTKKGFRLAMGDDEGNAKLDPMSNVAYRVLVARPEEPYRTFTVLNALFFGLVGLSGAGTVLAVRQARRAAPPRRSSDPNPTAAGPADPP